MRRLDHHETKRSLRSHDLPKKGNNAGFTLGAQEENGLEAKKESKFNPVSDGCNAFGDGRSLMDRPSVRE
jgi:hypothetical protein